MTNVEYEGRRLSFAEAGSALTLHAHCVFIGTERIHLGSHVMVSEFTWINAGVATHVGSFVHLANHASISGGGACNAEDFAGLSAGARLVTGTELVHGEGLTNPTVPAAFRAVRRSFVHLERHVFLGTNAVVHPGVTIGEGAVIGSGAVVTRDVAPWTVNVGTPARAIATRPSATVKRLEALADERLGVVPMDANELVGLKRDTLQLPTER